MKNHFKERFAQQKKKIAQLNDSQKVQQLFNIHKTIVTEIEQQIGSLQDRGRLIKDALKHKRELGGYKERFWHYITHANIRYVLSAPFIYAILIPAFFLHLFVELYHQIGFRLYRIPRVDPHQYFIFDRVHLPYLNWIEKMNCVYCSYFNGLMGYVREIAARTERFWCPIKHARQRAQAHRHYGDFVDYLDGKKYHNELDEIRDFSKDNECS